MSIGPFSYAPSHFAVLPNSAQKRTFMVKLPAITEDLLLAIAKSEKRKVWHYYNQISGCLESL